MGTTLDATSLLFFSHTSGVHVLPVSQSSYLLKEVDTFRKTTTYAKRVIKRGPVEVKH